MIWGEFLPELKSSAVLVTLYRFPLGFLSAHSKEILTGFPCRRASVLSPRCVRPLSVVMSWINEKNWLSRIAEEGPMRQMCPSTLALSSPSSAKCLRWLHLFLHVWPSFKLCLFMLWFISHILNHPIRARWLCLVCAESQIQFLSGI